MHCPNCQHILTKVTLDKIEVDHCNFCGATLFDMNEINRISLADARKLADIKQSEAISGNEKFSPKDGSPLERLEDDSVPQFVTLLHSKSTGEVFAYPDDLINFKQAQQAKISYFKSWQLPLPALQSVLVFSFFIVTTVSVIYTAARFQNPTSQTTQASALCTNKNIVERTDQGVLIYCETKSPFTCTARSVCVQGESVVELRTSADRTGHFAVLPTACTNVKIECAEGSTSIETDWIGL